MPELLKAVPFPNGSVESEALRWFDDIQLDGLWVPESKLQTFPDPPMRWVLAVPHGIFCHTR